MFFLVLDFIFKSNIKNIKTDKAITNNFIKSKSFSTVVSATKSWEYSIPLILYVTIPSFSFCVIGATILSLSVIWGFGISSFKFIKAVISFSTIKFRFFVSLVPLGTSIVWIISFLFTMF